LVSEGTLSAEMRKGKKKVAKLFLFNDTILLCLWSEKKSSLQFVANIPFSQLQEEIISETKFVVRIDKDNFWGLHCESKEQQDKWLSDIREVRDTYEVNELIESSLNNMKEGFHIISAHYGVLSSHNRSKDVTEVLRNISINQGGQLILHPEPKSTIFGNPAEGKKKSN